VRSLSSVFSSWWGNSLAMSPIQIPVTEEQDSLDTRVTQASAMGLSAISRSIALYGDALASAPINVIKNDIVKGGREIIQNDLSTKLRLWKFEDKEAFLHDLLLLGNGYVVNNTLEPISNWRVSVEVFEDGRIQYKVQTDSSTNAPLKIYQKDEITHFKYRLNGRNQVLGLSPLETCSPSIELSLTIREMGRILYRNQALPGSVLQTDLELKKEQIDALRERWDKVSKGRNRGGTPILTHGLKLNQHNLETAVNMQLAALMKLGVEEISRCYGVPAQLLSSSSDINYSSGVELMRSFISMSLQPLASRLSDTLSHSLLSMEELAEGYRIEIDLSSQLLGDGEQKSNYLSQMVNNGLLSVNEARNLSGFGDVENGDELRAPLNTSSLKKWIDFNPGKEKPKHKNIKKLKNLLD